MAINLKKNEKALLEAYNDVLNANTDTNWYMIALIGCISCSGSTH